MSQYPAFGGQSMSVAAMQARKFYEQCVDDGRVFTFCDQGDFLVYPVRQVEVVPFWSSRTRLTTIQASLTKYRPYGIDQIPLDQFYEAVLPRLEAEGLYIGVNWSGSRLTGYNLSVSDLWRNLDYWIARRNVV
jgi:hypothetical protein